MRLTYTITADTQQAERANATVEAGLQRVEAQAKKTGQVSATAHAAAADSAKEAERRIKALEKTWKEQDKAREQQWRDEEKRLRDQGKQTGVLEGQVASLARAMVAAFAVERLVAFGRAVVIAAQDKLSVALQGLGEIVLAVSVLAQAFHESGDNFLRVSSVA